MSLSKRLKLYFLGNFESDNFAYVLYPFLCIFKIFGFAPIKLKNGEIFRDGRKPEFSLKAWIFSFLDIVLYVVGFFLGVHHLSEAHNWLQLHEDTIIAYYTNWIQLVSIFILGAVTVISSWTHLNDMRRLCKSIFRIDQLLSSIEGIKIDYKQLRQRLFIEFIIDFIIPVSFSMVNCIIIQPSSEQFVLITSCFWFICFAPIMLLTFKEFQFCNLLKILKLKFELVNKKLRVFGGQRNVCQERRQRCSRISNVNSVSGIPLTIMPLEESNEGSPVQGEVLLFEEKPSVECLQKLLKIYAKIAESVELLLRIFSWHLVLLTTVSIGVIIIQCYNLFALLVNSLQMQAHQVFFVISWIIVQIAVIGINIGVCSETFKTMSQTGPLLHQIRRHSTSTDSENAFYQVLQIFSLEVLQRKQVFSAAGFFDMDYKLITSIIASVTTYLVIIIQFHLNNVPYPSRENPNKS